MGEPVKMLYVASWHECFSEVDVDSCGIRRECHHNWFDTGTVQ